MVKLPGEPPTLPKRKFSFFSILIWSCLIALGLTFFYFKLPSFIEIDDDGHYTLSKERLREYEEKIKKSEQVEVYQLIATRKGLYPCHRCQEILFIRLNPGEVWKYGISRNGSKRYPKDFYLKNKVEYITLITTDILSAEQLEKELIINYPTLPESQRRMKLFGIFLKRPPGNAKDQ